MLRGFAVSVNPAAHGKRVACQGAARRASMTGMARFLFLLTLGLGLGVVPPAALRAQEVKLVESGGFRLPEGFACQPYADASVVTDVSCLTIDARGRVVVSGPGYIKTLMPDPKAPADAPRPLQAVTFSSLPKSGAQGLCFVGDTLYATGDGGVWRFRDADGDGVADGAPEALVTGLMTGGEHGVHAIVHGPDGWLYVIGGNDSGISEKLNTIPQAPIQRVSGGAILRMSLDGKQREVIAHGFRNPYSLCFNAAGALFTWDSDGERVQHLPFYTPCRVFDVGRGRHHGWVNAGWQSSWACPAWWPDVVDRMIEVGRGSPTGMLCYRHHQFPERWRDGLFFACWTFGRIYYAKPERTRRGAPPALKDQFNASWSAKLEVFLESTGNAGFAPTGMAVAPDGSVYVSTGGRKTSGGVYRIAWKNPAASGEAKDAIDRVLAADQPEAAWSRARWTPLARELGAEAFEKRLLAKTVGDEEAKDLRAVEILTELFGGVKPEIGRHVSGLFRGDKGRMERARELPARLAWAAERNARLSETQANDWFMALAVEAGLHGHRAAHECVLMNRGRLGEGKLMDDIPAAVLEELKRGAHGGDADYESMRQIRLAQVRAGDVSLLAKARWDDGYVSGKKAEPAEAESLGTVWGRVSGPADYEYARLVALTDAEPEGFWESLPLKWTEDSRVEDDLHYLFVAARRTRPHAAVALPAVARAWLDVPRKMEAAQQYPSRFWDDMVEAAFTEMLGKNPDLAVVMVQQEGFNLPQHALYVRQMSGEVRAQAVAKLTHRVQAWTPELARLAGEDLKVRMQEVFKDENRQFDSRAQRNAYLWEKLRVDPVAHALVEGLMQRVTEPGLRDAVILALPEFAFAGRSQIAAEGLDSFQPSVVQRGLRALANNGPSAGLQADAEAWRALEGRTCVRLIHAMRRLEGQTAHEALLKELREACLRRLDEGTAPALASLEEAARKKYPEQAASLAPVAVLNLVEERVRWAKLDVTQGDASRGKVIFEQRQCARCHAGGSRLGPDLKGVTARWGVEDLFLHTADPSRQISPTWEGETFTLKDGRQFTGRPSYDSPDAVLVQITPDETVRITGAELQSRRKAEISLMPPGLIAGLSDGGLADLHAYLRSLK